MMESTVIRCISAAICLLGFGLSACSRPEPPHTNVTPVSSTATLTQGSARQTLAPNATVSNAPESIIPLTKRPVADPIASAPPPEAETTATTSTIFAQLALARQGGRADIPYQVPTPHALDVYRDAVVALLKSGHIDERQSAVPDGFRVQAVQDFCSVLVEQSQHRRGAGAVVVRAGPAMAVAVEVPHSFFDESTLPIGLALFEAARGRALFVNTVHRYSSRVVALPIDPSANDDDSGASDSDVAHAPSSFFLAAHDAFLRSYPSGSVVQIHGFSDVSAPGIDVIVSAANTPAAVEPIALRLIGLGWRVAIYPKDIRRLGGTTNVQAQLSRKHRQGFVHLELSQTTRRRLSHDQKLLREFSLAILPETR